MDTYCEQNIIKKATKQLRSISSLGFVMSFQPSMWDDKSTQSALDYTTHIIEAKLKNSCHDDCTKTMLARLKEVFNRLNFNTHRKSIAVMISAESEKVMYLNFPVRPFISTGNFISVLDLVASIKQEIGFYLLSICEGEIRLFEYYNKRVNKVFELKPDAVPGFFAGAGMQASSIITYMNSNYKKPVFFIGSTDDFNCFQSTVSYPEIIFQVIKPTVQYNAETIQIITTEIVEQWSDWVSKFDIARIAMAKNKNTLVFNYGPVLQALSNSTDGLILMDKRIKKELQKPAKGDTHFQDSKFFISQVEKFIDRGNSIGIKENGLLRDWGGIVLLPDKMAGQRNAHSPRGTRFSTESGNLF